MRSIKTRRDHGFSLFEMSLVMLVSGFIFIPLVRMYFIYQMEQRVEESREAVRLASSMVARYKTGLFNYPCPADASLPPTDANYGIGQGTILGQCAAAAGLAAPGDCTAGGGLCLVTGQRDVDGDGFNERVLIGTVPWNTILQTIGSPIPISSNDLMDAWGSRIMYAVSEDLTVPGGVDNLFYNGVVGAVDEFGIATAGVDNDAHYAVFSVGRDLRGGFNDQGNLQQPCNTVFNSRDFENCDYNVNGLFVQAKGYYLGEAGNTYYDDDIYFGKQISEPLWVYEPNMQDVRTTINGNAGVGTNAPNQRLHVDDPLGVAQVSADNNVFSERVCDDDPVANPAANCFDISAIAGDPDFNPLASPQGGGMRCPAGQVMAGISRGTVVDEALSPAAERTCETLTFPAALPNPSETCPNATGAGSYIRGFTASGGVICSP